MPPTLGSLAQPASVAVVFPGDAVVSLLINLRLTLGREQAAQFLLKSWDVLRRLEMSWDVLRISRMNQNEGKKWFQNCLPQPARKHWSKDCLSQWNLVRRIEGDLSCLLVHTSCTQADFHRFSMIKSVHLCFVGQRISLSHLTLLPMTSLGLQSAVLLTCPGCGCHTFQKITVIFTSKRLHWLHLQLHFFPLTA